MTPSARDDPHRPAAGGLPGVPRLVAGAPARVPAGLRLGRATRLRPPTRRVDEDLSFGAVFLGIFVEIWQAQPFARARRRRSSRPALVAQLAGLLAVRRRRAAARRARAAYLAGWVRLYGVVTIEVFGHLGFALDDAEPMFEAMLAEMGGQLMSPRPARPRATPPGQPPVVGAALQLHPPVDPGVADVAVQRVVYREGPRRPDRADESEGLAELQPRRAHRHQQRLDPVVGHVQRVARVVDAAEHEARRWRTPAARRRSRRARRPPRARRARATGKVSPGVDGVRRDARARRRATAAKAAFVCSRSPSRTAGASRSTSRWSACSWVTRTSATPARSASAE